MEKSIARQISEFSVGLEFDNLPAEVIHEVKRYMYDSVGCAYGGYHTKDVNIIREILLISVIFVLLFLVNPMSTLVVLVAIGLFVIIIYFVIKKKMINLSKRAQYSRARKVQLVNQAFGAIKDAKILSREKYFVNELYKGRETNSMSINNKILIK